MSARYDVLGLGNAIVDILAPATDAFLIQEGIAKNSMTLIDEYRARHLSGVVPEAKIRSGGSAANTIAGLAALGARCAFIGRVRNDDLGRAYREDMARLSVRFDTPSAIDGPPTARSFIFVTPDGHRSMNTYLGASVDLRAQDVDPALVADSAITYVEGYLWDPPEAKQAIAKAMDAAQASARQIAFTLSDPFCVGRWREEFRTIVDTKADILFANEHEILALYETDNFDDALQAMRASGRIAALTRSEKGAVILGRGEVHVVDAEPAEVVDTTGAGDLFAAGFLFGLTRGRDLATCGRMGAAAAAEVISQIGPRPERSLVALFAQKGLI
jgi:sugar/nucleoside kinase (ribokinase family)